MSVRKYTNEIWGMAEDGLISWETIAQAALKYMSEDDVKDMCHCNDFIDLEDDDDNT